MVDDKKDVPKTTAYESHVVKIITAVLDFVNPKIKTDRDQILQIAKQVGNFSNTIYNLTFETHNSTKIDKSNILANLNNISIDELQNITDSYISPNKSTVNWSRYLTLVFKNVTKTNKFNKTNDLILTSNSDLKYLKELAKFLLNTTTDEIELYIWWSVVEELIVHTTKLMRDLQHQYTQSLSKLESTVSRSLYCTAVVNDLMGMAVSHFVADPNFYDETKPHVVEMVGNIQTSFNTLLSDIDWMDATTKQLTLEKSVATKSLIGFPEWLLNRTALEEDFKNVRYLKIINQLLKLSHF